jgi:hypothetical protein
MSVLVGVKNGIGRRCPAHHVSRPDASRSCTGLRRRRYRSALPNRESPYANCDISPVFTDARYSTGLHPKRDRKVLARWAESEKPHAAAIVPIDRVSRESASSRRHASTRCSRTTAPNVVPVLSKRAWSVRTDTPTWRAASVAGTRPNASLESMYRTTDTRSASSVSDEHPVPRCVPPSTARSRSTWAAPIICRSAVCSEESVRQVSTINELSRRAEPDELAKRRAVVAADGPTTSASRGRGSRKDSTRHSSSLPGSTNSSRYGRVESTMANSPRETVHCRPS